MAPTNLASQWQVPGVWTGTRMLVLGSADSAAYDPCTDQWSKIPPGLPSGTDAQSGVLGSRYMLIFPPDGAGAGAGAYLDPEAKSWTPMNMLGAPQRKDSLYSVFVAGQVLVFGGTPGPDPYNGVYVDFTVGHRYDLAKDGWESIAAAGGLSPRRGDARAIIDGKLVIWGGSGTSGAPLQDGAVYDLALGQWHSISLIGAPQGGTAYSASTGSELIVWNRGSGGAIYSPSTNAWRPITTTKAPTFNVQQSIWTGEQLFLFGEAPGTQASVSPAGALYDPKADRWTSINVNGAPSLGGNKVLYATASGKVLFVIDSKMKSGILYDPSTDRFSPVDQAGVPTHPSVLTVWTGARLISWFGVESMTNYGQCMGVPGCDPIATYQYFAESAIYHAP
jgi:N-acetylneuraminic acid mutarotase